jgi:hypothetical protein
VIGQRALGHRVELAAGGINSRVEMGGVESVEPGRSRARSPGASAAIAFSISSTLLIGAD